MAADGPAPLPLPLPLLVSTARSLSPGLRARGLPSLPRLRPALPMRGSAAGDAARRTTPSAL